MRRVLPSGFSHFRFPKSILNRVLLATTILFLALEIWRPCFFLTDDNLSVGLPFLTEMGRHLKHGQSPFYSDYLFGGHYDLLRDANYFSWSPINFMVSLLADTPGKFWMFDILAFFNMLLAAAGFVVLGTSLREELQLKLSDGRLAFYTLSFVFSTFILTCGASWANFLANQAVLPWLVLGLWQRTWRRSLGLLILFSLHQVLSGQSAGTISNGIFLTLFALLICVYRRSFRPMGAWMLANAITLILILPIILPASDGFLHSQRSAGLSVALLNRFAMPADLFPISLLFGNFFEMAAFFAGIPVENILYFPRMATLLASAAAWCIFPALFQLRRWTFLEASCAALICLLSLMVIRPIFITEMLSHLPVLRSMRWPFREILQLQFFFHLLLVLRPQFGSVSFQNRLATTSFALFFLPLLFTGPVSLNPLTADRNALFSGEADRFWKRLKSELRPGDRIATVIDIKLWSPTEKLPYSLLGTADFPAYFQVPCISGYSQTAPLDQLAVPVQPYYWFGAYDPSQIPTISKGPYPLRILTLEEKEPLRISLSNPSGPPIDISPSSSR